MGMYQMSLFPDEDVFTREIETWRDFIDKLPSDEDKVVFTKLLNNCYKYSVAIIIKHKRIHFQSLSVMALLLVQHKLINQLKPMINIADGYRLIRPGLQKNIDEFEDCKLQTHT